MAKIRIVGDSSGYVELAAPNAAGNNTLELPSSGTRLVGSDSSGNVNITGISTFTTGPVLIGSGTSTGTASQRLQVTGGAYVSGSFGIGTTNPNSNSLTMVGSATLGSTYQHYISDGTRNLRMGVNSTAAEIQSTGSVPLYLNYGGNNIVMFGNVSGSLGIGTISPTSTLHVYGGSGLTVERQTGSTIAYFKNTSSTSPNIAFQASGTVNTPYIGVNNDDLILGTSNTERLRIDSSGRMGLGTNNPSNLIHLYSTSDGAELLQLEIGAQPVSSEKAKIIWRATQTNGQSAKLASIGSTAVSNWGGEFQIFTKPANGTPNDTIVERVRIDSSGRMTIPYQPGFQATSTSGNTTQPATGDTDNLGPRFDSTSQTGGFNTGNHYNTTTGVFTAPVSGKYYTFFNMRWETGSFVQNNYIRIFVSVNNASTTYIHQICGTNEAWNSYMPMSCSGVVSLSAGDTLRPKGGMAGGTAYGYWNECSWGAWLLG